MLPIIIIIALLVNLLIETTESFTVVVPRDQTVARVGSTVTLPCWISPPENAEVLEIRWYRQEFSKPVLLYQNGKIIQEESYRNRSSLTLWSDQSGGLKDGDVSLRLEKLTVQDEGSFRCYISGESVYDSGKVVLKVIDSPDSPDASDSPDSPDSSDLWKALFFTLLICAVLGLVGLILYKYTQKNTIRFSGKKPEEQICEDGGMEKLTEEAVGEINIEELRKHAVKITIDQHYVSPNLTISKDRKIMREGKEYKHTGEGFPYELYAYGAQTFTSGRHYWEVELARANKPPKNYWLIGVAKHENFRVKDKSFTPSNGFWFLCSDGPNGFYISSDPKCDPLITLSLTPRPERLGVLLDYGEGQLSFYNVKERKHVLTMNTRFTGAVAPLFNPGVGDQSSLMILDCPEPVETPVESSEPLLRNSSDA
ncbi:butyrophilin subfamily 2 member A2-like isoform X7 [Pimephales promelas]|uniref:butyrophilin subfamily 2 member A2-like isoform X7 n=1 Tax=Pimephales promelas TaxID=90988 RepID=UPI00195576BA|nr:butyrophilin subfamily 2 member A2-like isoform X7 [Pimephales promelas]